jgi:flavin reductase (DIM6/NTAB) family NADH-FMN oxidoreductase RutF
MPTTIIGALVNGRQNYATIAHVGIMDHESISLSMAKIHYTNAGIKAHGTFSVNIPSTDLVEKTDYCGLVSDRDADKSTVFARAKSFVPNSLCPSRPSGTATKPFSSRTLNSTKL